MKLKFMIASVLAAASVSASAGDQFIDVSKPNSNGITEFTSDGTVFSGGDNMDVLSFTGLASGTYNFVVQLLGTNVYFDSKSNLNGSLGTDVINGKYFHYFGVDGSKPTPLALNLFGNAIPGTPFTGNGHSYMGSISVTAAVPEPETYAMLLAGLGIVGFLARRRRPTTPSETLSGLSAA